VPQCVRRDLIRQTSTTSSVTECAACLHPAE
jgi:hypothetical protein